jgi:hypothetical protein
MHRVGGRIGRILGVLALLGTALFAATTVAAPPAFADGSSDCSTNYYLCTIVSYSGDSQPQPRDPNGEGGSTSGSGGYISSCWLQPQTAWGDPNTLASSPAGLEQYLNDMAAFGDHIGGFQTWFQPMYQLYDTGKGADPGIGLTAPPFNTGVSGGQWYGIACVPSDNNYEDYVAIQTAMGVTGVNLTEDYENWFWITDPKAVPPSVQVMTPSLLGRYAANHVAFTLEFPTLSPPVGTVQTVNLPVESADSQSASGYQEYSTTATIPGMTSTVTTYPVSVTYTASPSGLINPSSVTCYFNEDGTFSSPCPTFQFTTPEQNGATITATSTWNVTWNGDDGEAPWTEQLPGPALAVVAPITIQEIQTIN